MAEPLIYYLIQPFNSGVGFFEVDDCNVGGEWFGNCESFNFAIDVYYSSKDAEVLIMVKSGFYGSVFCFQSWDFVASAKVAPSCLKSEALFDFGWSDAGILAFILG